MFLDSNIKDVYSDVFSMWSFVNVFKGEGRVGL